MPAVILDDPHVKHVYQIDKELLFFFADMLTKNMKAFFATCKPLLYVYGDSGGGQAQLCRGGQGGLWLPGGLPLCPVVPEGVVAFVLIEADTVAEFGAYLVGVDAGEEGGELADGHTEGVLVPRCRGYDHVDHTPPVPVVA